MTFAEGLRGILLRFFERNSVHPEPAVAGLSHTYMISKFRSEIINMLAFPFYVKVDAGSLRTMVYRWGVGAGSGSTERGVTALHLLHLVTDTSTS